MNFVFFAALAMLALFSWLSWGSGSLALIWVHFFPLLYFVHNGLYWDVFEHGEGYFTTNRVTAYVALVAAAFGPLIVRATHWFFIGHSRWREKVLREHAEADARVAEASAAAAAERAAMAALRAAHRR